MVTKAREWIEANDFDFIVTGEVIGQRPMSQRRDTMPVVAQDSGANDRLLRPLSAKLLPPTLPERIGWVDREALRGLSGRSRKPQIALAERYGIDDFAQPAGGCCFLTNAQYSVKLADLWRMRGERDYDFDDIMLLKVGRHMRPRPHFKVIIGREDGENRFLEGYRRRFTSLRTVSHNGPIALIDGEANADDMELTARLVARFSQGRDAPRVRIEIAGDDSQTLEVKPLASDEIPSDWYI